MSDQGQDQTDDQDRNNKNSWLQVLGVPSHLFSSTPDDDDDAAAATESSAGSSDDSTQGSATQPSAVTQSSSTSAAPAGGQSSEDFAAGYQDGLSGGDANPGPRIDDALTDYEEGYAKGHDEFGHGASSAIGPPPAPSLDEQYRTALQAENWQSAAEFLNGFDHDDIQSRLSELTLDMVASLHQGALDNPRLGVNSQVAQMTRDPNARDPDEDDPNTIYAGEHFKIKMLEGVSFGEVAGPTSVTFAYGTRTTIAPPYTSTSQSLSPRVHRCPSAAKAIGPSSVFHLPVRSISSVAMRPTERSARDRSASCRLILTGLLLTSPRAIRKGAESNRAAAFSA